MSDKGEEPAFPTHACLSGMSLREWYAGQALAGLSACPLEELDDHSPEGIAKLAFAYADAMLARSEKE